MILDALFAGLPIVHGPHLTKDLAEWAARRIPHVGEAGFGPCWACGVVRGRALAAVVVYHDWQPEIGTIQVSMAARTPLWASRAVIRAILGVPFAGAFGAPARKVWAVMPSANERALKFNAGVGFRREAVLRHHFADGVHAIVASMLRSEYLRRYGELMIDGQESAKAA